MRKHKDFKRLGFWELTSDAAKDKSSLGASALNYMEIIARRCKVSFDIAKFLELNWDISYLFRKKGLAAGPGRQMMKISPLFLSCYKIFFLIFLLFFSSGPRFFTRYHFTQTVPAARWLQLARIRPWVSWPPQPADLLPN